MGEGVSIIIPVCNGGETFVRCLDGIRKQEFVGKIDIVIVDSGSTDGSVDVANRAGARVSNIENKDFHHSRTRNSVLQLAKFEKVVYFVQDAIPVSTKWLSQLCEALDQEGVAAVSVRQIPHADADVLARFEVELHGMYLGDKPRLQQIESPDEFSNLSYDDALHKIRHDNVCSIYHRSLLERYPFPDVDFAEDMAWAHMMLLRGHKILYDPGITVWHSHNRPPEYRFKRSIVDSISCAKILGRVKEDISYLSILDILEMRNKLVDYSTGLKKKFVAETCLHQRNFDISRFYFFVRKFVPFLKKMRQITLRVLGKTNNNCKISQLQRDLCNHIGFVTSMIVGRYSLSTIVDYTNCIDQVTATTLGRFYGEVYSGYMLKGGIPPEIDDLIQPYLKGV